MQGCPYLSIRPSLCPNARIAKRLPRAPVPMAGTETLELAVGYPAMLRFRTWPVTGSRQVSLESSE